MQNGWHAGNHDAAFEYSVTTCSTEIENNRRSKNGCITCQVSETQHPF